MKRDTGIIKLIKKKLKAGYPAGELKNDLLSKGYNDEEIETWFLDISSKGAERAAPQSSKMHILSLAGVSFIITGITIKSTQTWLKEYGTFIIVLGAISLCAGYFISTNGKSNRPSS